MAYAPRSSRERRLKRIRGRAPESFFGRSWEDGDTSNSIWTPNPIGNEGGIMIERKLSITDIILFAGTRVALGVGIGLLLSGRLSHDQRKAAGVALAVVGGLTTAPL